MAAGCNDRLLQLIKANGTTPALILRGKFGCRRRLAPSEDRKHPNLPTDSVSLKIELDDQIRILGRFRSGSSTEFSFALQQEI
jgi:hypothetical protein